MESQQGDLFALPLPKRPRPSSHAGGECEQVSEKKVHCAPKGKQIFNVEESDGKDVAGGIARDAIGSERSRSEKIENQKGGDLRSLSQHRVRFPRRRCR